MTEEMPDRVIRGMACHYHSKWRGVPIYHAYDVKTGKDRMRYYALTDDLVLEANILADMRHTIGQHLNGVPLTYGEAWERRLEDGAYLKFCPEVKG